MIVESTVINEYLDEVFPEVSLKPNDPQARATMRVWTKAVDEVLHPACAEVTFSSCLRHRVKRLPPKEYEKFLASTPSLSITPQWRERRRELVTLGFDAPGTPYVNRLDMLGWSQMWEQLRPQVTAWFKRIKARTAFEPALLNWCPPDLTADLLTFGRQSWPSAERLLAGKD